MTIKNNTFSHVSNIFTTKSSILILLLLLSNLLFSQTRRVGGFATIDEINRPGVGGISISIKGTSSNTITDNDGEWRINVPDNKAVLLFSYPGMISQEIAVEERSRIDVDLVKIPSAKTQTISVSKIGIVLDKYVNESGKNIAKVLKERLQKNSKIEVSVLQTPDLSAGLNIYLGLNKKSDELEKICREKYITLPGINSPTPEGYSVKMVNVNNAPTIIAIAADRRGLLYAVGEILRQVESEELSVKLTTFDVSTSPNYRFRGTNNPQGGTIRKYTKAREWTTEEQHEVILDYALAGANCFYSEEWGDNSERTKFLKSFDLLTLVGIRPNQYSEEHPKEWKAGGLSDWEGENWICPSIPEAREALLIKWRKNAKTLGEHDILRFYGGDPGGCRDERCMPWGDTFVRLCEDISKIILETHPNINIQIANQDMSNEGDYAIFNYLSAKPQKWLYGIAYGPGSNAMSWYFRRELNEDIFEYPGYGWLNRYLAETLNRLPKEQKIVHFSDITHWIMSQYNVTNPERNMVKAYGRRTWHTRPVALYNIFQAIMPFSQGDITYTEGYHDHFNQYFWMRLLWNSHQSAEDVVKEYCKVNFGKDATEFMTKAIFQLEKNFEIPLASNNGIDRYYTFVKEAGKQIPENIMGNDHLWRLFMQKASLDKYNQLKLQHELFMEERISKILEKAINSKNINSEIDKSLMILDEPNETPAMIKLREEADQLGIESEKIFGFRNVGYFKLKQNLRDIDGLSNNLEKAKTIKSEKEKISLIMEIIRNREKKTDYIENY